MTPREKFFRAVLRQDEGMIPFRLDLCPALTDELERRYGTRDPQTAFDLPIRYVGLPPTRLHRDFRSCFDMFPENAYTDEWGVGYAPGSVAHFAKFLSPMKDFTEPGEVWRFPVPDVLADYRWESVERQVEKIHADGYPAVFSAVQVFEPAWYLRGLENLLADMLTDEEMARACLDRMTGIQKEVAVRAAKAGFDAILYGDDVATQRAMMMSLSDWEKWLRPTMEICIREAKAVKPDLIAIYHSDGVIYDIVPQLIEIGVDVLNPVQPECVDPVLLKTQYGDRLSFWGCVGTQTVMPFGTAEDVRRTVRELAAAVGKGGGLVLAPTHMLEPEVPWENVEAFVSECRRFWETDSISGKP